MTEMSRKKDSFDRPAETSTPTHNPSNSRPASMDDGYVEVEHACMHHTYIHSSEY